MIKYLFLFLTIGIIGCEKKSNNPPADPYVKISINDVSLPEGTGGTNNFDFIVSLDKAANRELTIKYITEPGTATAEDFIVINNGTLLFQPGETSKKIIVSIITDDIRESDEQFTVKLISTTNGIIEKSIGTGTIENDDTQLNIPNTGYDAPASYPGYTLAWADEFNSNSLDTSAWSFDIGDGCPNLCGWGNNELEYYTNRTENLFFQDGKMVIEARKENFSGKNYTSAKIHTRNKKTFKYGRVDVRAKLPRGKGIWPAIWMLPQNNTYGGWPRSGEIDIMEMVGHEPSKVHGTIHYGPGPGSIQKGSSYSLPSATFNDEFHVFSLEWKENLLKWYVDNNLFLTVNKADLGSNNYPFNEDFYFIINLAVGGNWPGNPDATTAFPQWLIVDYLRVYKEN
jgi:beta-glucanase (GH16 family)